MSKNYESISYRKVIMLRFLQVKSLIDNFALAIFQALANTLRRFCPRRILATHEPAAYQQTPSISIPSGFPNPRIRMLIRKKLGGWKAYMRFFARGIAQVNTPNATMDLCKLRPPFLRQRYRSSEYSKCHGILAIWSLRSEICRIRNSEVVVRTSTSRPFRPLGHIYQATTLWPVVNVQPYSVRRTPPLYMTCCGSDAWRRGRCKYAETRWC